MARLQHRSTGASTTDQMEPSSARQWPRISPSLRRFPLFQISIWASCGCLRTPELQLSSCVCPIRLLRFSGSLRRKQSRRVCHREGRTDVQRGRALLEAARAKVTGASHLRCLPQTQPHTDGDSNATARAFCKQSRLQDEHEIVQDGMH